MKNKDIITLANGGFLVATAHCLPEEHFYKFHKFRRAVERAVRAISDSQAALMRDCGIDPEKFTEAPAKKKERYYAANKALLDEDSDVKVNARIPFEFYKGVYDENQTEKVDIFANVTVESLIIENLFIEPEEGGQNE